MGIDLGYQPKWNSTGILHNQVLEETDITKGGERIDRKQDYLEISFLRVLLVFSQPDLGYYGEMKNTRPWHSSQEAVLS